MSGPLELRLHVSRGTLGAREKTHAIGLHCPEPEYGGSQNETHFRSIR